MFEEQVLKHKSVRNIWLLADIKCVFDRLKYAGSAFLSKIAKNTLFAELCQKGVLAQSVKTNHRTY